MRKPKRAYPHPVHATVQRRPGQWRVRVYNNGWFQDHESAGSFEEALRIAVQRVARLRDSMDSASPFAVAA